jgi:hypothetical protein
MTLAGSFVRSRGSFVRMHAPEPRIEASQSWTVKCRSASHRGTVDPAWRAGAAARNGAGLRLFRCDGWGVPRRGARERREADPACSVMPLPMASPSRLNGHALANVLGAQAADVHEAGEARALLEAGGRKEIAMMVPTNIR